jgi:hypothetical protein
METYAHDGSRFIQDYEEHGDESHFKCHLIDSNERGTEYTVRIVMNNKHVPVFLYNYPEKVFTFLEAIYVAISICQMHFATILEFQMKLCQFSGRTSLI